MSKVVVISARLAAVVKLVPSGARVVDVGTDHALVPIALYQSGIAEYLVAVDIKPGPLEAARINVNKYGMEDCISVRMSDGLSGITAGEVDTAIISGMGGGQIVSILDEAEAVVKQLNCLILQPQEATAAVRAWLSDNGWSIIEEQLVEERGIIYEIVKATRTCARQDTLNSYVSLALPYEVGPVLFRRREALLSKLLSANIEQLERVIAQMQKARTVDTKKIGELKLKKIELSGVLDSLR